MKHSNRLSNLGWRELASLGVKLTLVLVVVPFVLVAVPQLVGATNSFVVLSNSMADEPAPSLQAGDVIFVYQTAPENIEAGDVITYRSGENQMTTHRVVTVQDSGGTIAFETKGDTNEEADSGVVHPDQVVGTVGFYIPSIGRVVTFAGTSYGLVALVIIPSALLILSELVNIGQLIRKSREEPTLADGGEEGNSEQIHD